MDRPLSLCWRGPISNITGSSSAPWRESPAGSQISRFGLSADEAVISPNTMLSQCGGDAGWPGWKPQNGETTLMTMSKTKVGKYQALQLTQAVTFSDSPGFSLDLNTLVTVKGTDVFAVVDLSGTNDPGSADLMLKFINRGAKLR